MSIRTKLLILFFSILLISLAFLGVVSFYGTKDFLHRAALNALYVVSEIREGEVLLNLSRLKTRTEDFASDGFIAESLEAGTTGENLNEYLLKRKKILEENLNFIDILNASGKVAASTIPARVGLDESAKKYFIHGTNSPYIADLHKALDGTVGIEVAAPIRKRGHTQVIGILVNHFNMAMLDRIMTGRFKLDIGAKTQFQHIARTDETYIVNQDRVMVTSSRFMDNSAFRQRVDTYPVRKCLEEDTEVRGEWLDYRRVPVVGSSMCLSLGDFKWTLVAEQDKEEAFERIDKLRDMLVFFEGIVLLIVALVVWATAKIISDPIRALHKGVETIGRGNLDYKVGTNAKDEIGQLSRAFDQMTANLKKVMASRDSLDEEMRRRKEAEEHLRRSEEKYRNLVDNALVGVFSSSLDGQIFYVNDAMAKMMEFDSPEEMKKTRVVARYENPQDREVFIARLKESGRVDNYELDVVTKNHKPKKILISATLEGKRLLSGMAVDITEREWAREALLERTVELSKSNEELERFNQLAAGRELRIVELKQQINELSRQAGKEPPYDLSFKDAGS